MDAEHRHQAIAVNATDDTADITVNRVLDVTGLECPLPILKTKVELTRMQPGEILQVLATDPMAPVDFRVFCVRSKNELIRLVEAEQRFEFYIRKIELA